MNTENNGGFYNLPQNKIYCKHPEHNPPMFLYIPQGKGYKHVCPCCGKESKLVSPQISF